MPKALRRKELGLGLAALAMGLASCNWMPASPTRDVQEVTPATTYNIPLILALPAPTSEGVPTPRVPPPATPPPAPAPAPPAPAPAPTAARTPEPEPQDKSDDDACPVPSQIRIKVHLANGPNGSVMDSVALACNRAACAGYKFPDGTSRQCCPLGPEGSARRVQCEQEMVPDGPSWQVRGGSDRDHPTNPWLHFVHPPASVRACLPQGVCSDWLSVQN
jgi:hypothetical protein